MSETQFTSLNFFQIKQKLIDHYQAQTDFQDVNFLGSAANVMVDTMAMALHHMAVHSNFAISETFLDSVQKRANALSRAKELGYPLATVSAAIMKVRIDVSNQLASDPDITIPKGSIFEASTTENTVSFVNLSDIVLSKEQDDLGAFVDETVRQAEFDIYQGRIIEQSFTFNATGDFQVYELQDADLDARLIKLTVAGEEWKVYEGLDTIDPDSKIFYVRENSLGKVEIFFGDNILGKKPLNGDDIVITSLQTAGEDGNGVVVITYPLQSSNSDYSISILETSQGGAPQHSVNRIAKTAPLNWQAQNRAVTKNDYKGILLSKFSWIDTLQVWGGEENDPPIYGSVFISIKPKNSTSMSSSLANIVQNEVLDKYSVLGIIPELVEPDYTFIDVTSKVYWLSTKTTSESLDILNDSVLPAVTKFFDEEVSDFDQEFLFSQFVGTIDDSNLAISHNDTSLSLSKKDRPVSFQKLTFTYSFRNLIQASTFRSDPITLSDSSTITLKDNGVGQIDKWIGNTISEFGVGSINYTTGEFNLCNFQFETNSGTEVVFRANPQNNDIISLNNSLLVLGDANISMVRYD